MHQKLLALPEFTVTGTPSGLDGFLQSPPKAVEYRHSPRQVSSPAAALVASGVRPINIGNAKHGVTVIPKTGTGPMPLASCDTHSALSTSLPSSLPSGLVASSSEPGSGLGAR
jgi:hypothetical protein